MKLHTTDTFCYGQCRHCWQPFGALRLKMGVQKRRQNLGWQTLVKSFQDQSGQLAKGLRLAGPPRLLISPIQLKMSEPRGILARRSPDTLLAIWRGNSKLVRRKERECYNAYSALHRPSHPKVQCTNLKPSTAPFFPAQTHTCLP